VPWSYALLLYVLNMFNRNYLGPTGSDRVVRGWVWRLSVLWVAAGAVVTGFIFYGSTKPYDPTLGIQSWAETPVPFQVVEALALIAWVALLIPMPIAGFVRLRGWRRGNWLRAAAWAGTWIAGVALYGLAAVWGQYPYDSCPYVANAPVPTQCPYGSAAVVSWGELPICAAWLVLGVVMTRILAVLTRRSDGVQTLPGSR
jgi:hypothetical protein